MEQGPPRPHDRPGLGPGPRRPVRHRHLPHLAGRHVGGWHPRHEHRVSPPERHPAGRGRDHPQAPSSVVGFYPGTDVNHMWKDDIAGTREAAELFTGGTPAQYPERYREVSPTTDVQRGLQRTLLVVGDRDRSARPETIKHFGASLRAEGVDTTVKELPFAEHAFDDAYGSLTSQTSRQILLDFLSKDT
ncbi:prolyl oligopeptidase family serine peptidase [Streptomyces sp. MS1.HAVA.3]|uniref:Prolyl oligopeptidase family serine peptidase n=1 Tax=Streptomyces caledonius TaxID=3134107 RepID=A0ABU8TZV8_9ACTN